RISTNVMNVVLLRPLNSGIKMGSLLKKCEYHCTRSRLVSVGQLLKWMDSTACLSAERHAGSPCITNSVDDVHFDHTIGVGQVVNIKAKVNGAFTSSMKVCGDIFFLYYYLCVVQRRARHTPPTNTLCVRVQMQVIPRTQAEQMEYSIAAERRWRMRLIPAEIITDLLSSSTAQLGTYKDPVPAERTQVESVALVLPPHIMAWMENVATIAAPSHIGDRLVLKAIVNNVGVCAEAYQGAFTLYIIISCNQTEVPLSVPWDISNQLYLSYNNVSALKIMAAPSENAHLHTLENQMLCFKVETHVNVPAEQAFHLLSDLRRRHEWDRHYPWVTVTSIHNDCSHNKCGNLYGPLISLSLCILPQISYYNQATPGVLHYISNDIAGLSSTFHSCSKYREENRDSLATLPLLTCDEMVSS
uniref:Acyl-CoA thioesterase 11b n=1 Tax=Oncorhynchus mykiss TaxID=8022 RepID=A0A8K9V714_ONCMY